MEVTAERLAMVEKMESALRKLGFHDLRARLVSDQDEMVRIEVGEEELGRLMEVSNRRQIIKTAHQSGFKFVTVDLEGFRSGRMNEGLIGIGSRLS